MGRAKKRYLQKRGLREQRSFSGRDPELLEQRREELLAAGLSADLEAFDTSDPEKSLPE